MISDGRMVGASAKRLGEVRDGSQKKGHASSYVWKWFGFLLAGGLQENMK